MEDTLIQCCNGCSYSLLRWEISCSQNSGPEDVTSFTKTNEQSVDDTHALWLCAQVSSAVPRLLVFTACLESEHTHFQASWLKVDQIAIATTLIFELAAWNSWQSVLWLVFLYLVYLNSIVLCCEIVKLPNVNFTDLFVHHHEKEGHSVDRHVQLISLISRYFTLTMARVDLYYRSTRAIYYS